MNKTKSQSQPSPHEPSLSKTDENTGLENEGESFEADITDEELAVNIVKVRRELTSTEAILDEVHTFYKDLYSCTSINKDKSNEILNFISEKVFEDDMENLEAEFGLDDIKAALLKAFLIKVDQEKAFDKVDHDYLFQVLEKFGFGPKFIQWINIFYKNVNSSVKGNGLLTKYVKLNNSIKQGCPDSTLLCVFVAEPLGQAIIKNKNIKGVVIPNSNKGAKMFQHADDTNIFTADKISIKETFRILNLYSEASGATINKQKSEILCIGSSIE
ncbi:unnamed protein product [Mytilus coruscus]|uniref:Reverse transcriptase domain-containing protein n=1 Tax=Mytilus coruscus TaxID=42192 RepID=A0A6J8EUL6_MYTCO|nr:unnamed protein product [Mytilus coruscus]